MFEFITLFCALLLANMSLSKSLTGKNIAGKYFPAQYEIHIFLAPVNPSEDEVKCAIDTVKQWNDIQCQLNVNNPFFKKMKMCLLALEFRKMNAAGVVETVPVRVLQSARYFHTDDFNEVVEQCHQDAKFFADSGLSVLREKVEANVFGVGSGIPDTPEDMKKDDKYFESHIKISLRNQANSSSSSVSEDELGELRKISREFEKKYNVPVPLSYNCLQHPDGGYQRFLNIRFRYPFMKTSAEAVLEELVNSFDATSWKCEKYHWEYIVFDTLTSLDFGWIDFDSFEKIKSN